MSEVSLYTQSRFVDGVSHVGKGGKAGGDAHKNRLVNQEDTRVGLEVDPRSLFHHLETLDGDISLVGEPETNEIQHFDGLKGFLDHCCSVYPKRLGEGRGVP